MKRDQINGQHLHICGTRTTLKITSGKRTCGKWSDEKRDGFMILPTAAS